MTAMLLTFLLLEISIAALLKLVIYIVIIGCVFYLLWWLVAKTEIPDPFAKIARALIALVAVILLIKFLLDFADRL